MTIPVILYGTQSNGETLPVQVDATGRLVAEGLKGDPGEPGPPGGVAELPPDPYEGAVLGWLNGGLAWIGTPPVPLPEGVFGPITAWDPVSGALTIEGEIPSGVGNGVYIYQVDNTGKPVTPGYLAYERWENFVTGQTSTALNAFDSNVGNRWEATPHIQEINGSSCIFDFSEGIPFSSQVRVQISSYSGSGTNYGTLKINGIDQSPTTGAKHWHTASIPKGYLYSMQISRKDPWGDYQNSYGCSVYQIEVDGVPLLTSQEGTQMRVNNVVGDLVVGVQTGAGTFEVGNYLYMPAQRVAPWVLYGNDPTSLIDHLRRTRD